MTYPDKFPAETGSFRLWSLWEMIQIKAQSYLTLGANLLRAEQILQLFESSGMSLDDDEKRELKTTMQSLAMACRELEMTAQEDAFTRAANDPPQTKRELEFCIAPFRSEFKVKKFFALEPSRARFFNAIPSDKMALSFPLAWEELRRSGNCYALNEYTASVFHSMRAAEIALKALAVALKVTLDPEVSQWRNVLDQVGAKIRDMEQEPKDRLRDKRLQYYSEAASQFRYFKDAWRNYVSHAKASYDEGQALTVREHVLSLLEHISGHLSEKKTSFRIAQGQDRT
jgi:HEPN domain-containing protein